MLQISQLEKNKDSLVRMFNKKALQLSKSLEQNIFVQHHFRKRHNQKQKNEAKPQIKTRGIQERKNNSPYQGKNALAESSSSGPGKDKTEVLIPLKTKYLDETSNYNTRWQFMDSLAQPRYSLIMDDTPHNWANEPGKKLYATSKKGKSSMEQYYPTNLMDSLAPPQKRSILSTALNQARQNSKKISNSKKIFEHRQKTIYKHQIYWHKKFTLSFACLIFFFIGAPLGSIIRKGGLGTPLVLSVILFIIYYIISISGENFVEKGIMPAYIGMWLSSIILLPVGIFLTYKATNDSVIMSPETYGKLIRKILRFKPKKNDNSREEKGKDFHEQ